MQQRFECGAAKTITIKMANLQYLTILLIAIVCANSAIAQRRGGGMRGMGMGGMGRRPGGPGGMGRRPGGNGGGLFGRRPQQPEDDNECGENEMWYQCRGEQTRQEPTCEMAQKLMEMRQAAKESGEDFARPQPEMVDCEDHCRCRRFHVRMADGSCAPIRECLGEAYEEERPKPWGNRLPQSRPRPFASLGVPNRERSEECTVEGEMYYECPADGEQVRQEPTCEMAQKLMEMRQAAKDSGENFDRPEPEMVDCEAGCKCGRGRVRDENGVCISMRECLGEGPEGSDDDEEGGRRPGRPGRPGSNMRDRFQNMRDNLRNRINNRRD